MNAKSLIPLAVAAVVLAAAGVAWWATSDASGEESEPSGEAEAREARRAPTRKDRKPPSEPDQSQATPIEAAPSDEGVGTSKPNDSEPDRGTDPVVDVSAPPHDPAVDIVKGIEDARLLFESGRIAQSKAELAKLSVHAPLSRFAAVKAELARDGAFPWRTLLVGELKAAEDNDALWGLFEESAARFQADPSGKAWREGELTWLALLAGRCVAVVGANQDRQLGIARMLETTRLDPVVDAVLNALEGVAESQLTQWRAAFRQLTVRVTSEKSKRQAGALLLRSTDEAGRAALFDDPALAQVRTDLIRVALDQKLVPVGELRSVARQEIVNAATTGGRSGQSAARALFDAFTRADDAAALELSRELAWRDDLPSGLRTAALTIVAAQGSEQERAELVAAAKGTGVVSVHALDALVAAKVETPWDDVFRETQNPAAKALALEQLNAGPERMKWIGEALGTDMSRVLRVKAASLLDGRVESEQTRLRELAEQDRDPSLRKVALQRLGSLHDEALAPFFRARAAGDEDPTVQALARDLAKALE